MSITFVLVTINHTYFDTGNAPQFVTNRHIVKLSDDLRSFAEDYIQHTYWDNTLEFAVQESDTLYTKPFDDGNGHYVAFHFTPFPAERLPHFAKQLSKNELQDFLEYASVELGLQFTKG